jgi:hypothetical protein
MRGKDETNFEKKGGQFSDLDLRKVAGVFSLRSI